MPDSELSEAVASRRNILKEWWWELKSKFRKKQPSPLNILADQELAIYYSPDSDYYDTKTKTNMLADSLKILIKEFSKQGHSGMSAHVALRHFFYLANFCKLDGTCTWDKNRRAFCGVFNNRQVQKFIKIISDDKEQREKNKKSHGA